MSELAKLSAKDGSTNVNLSKSKLPKLVALVFCLLMRREVVLGNH